MSQPDWHPLLDVPPFPASGYAALADRLAAILRTRNDVLLVQGEAIIALEAVATSLARPGLRAVNIITSPYGGWFGAWLRRGGSEVVDVTAEAGLPARIEVVAEALSKHESLDVVALVHAESASGILNPLEEIVRLAHAKGAIVVVDAVASVGGHALDVDNLGADIVVIGPQKSLGGSPGASAISIGKAAWPLIERPGALELSTLSLFDLKRQWLDRGRGALPGMPSALEFHALVATLDRVEAEGLEALIARHRLAAEACRDGLRALGIEPWVPDSEASNLVTAARVPDGIDPARLLAALAPFNAGIAPGVGAAASRLVRLNHTGPRARFDVVLANVIAYGRALTTLGTKTNLPAAAEAIAARYAKGAG